MQNGLSFEEYLQSISKEDWERLWELIPLIEQADQFGHWEGVESLGAGFQMPYYVAGEEINLFLKVIDSLKLLPIFDWMNWPVGKHIVETNDIRPEDHTLEEFCMILTVMVRGNRFSEGLIGNCFERGLVLKILKTMKDKVERNFS